MKQIFYLTKQEIAITKALSDCPNSVTYMASAVKRISSDVHEVLILMELYTGKQVTIETVKPGEGGGVSYLGPIADFCTFCLWNYMPSDCSQSYQFVGEILLFRTKELKHPL